MGTGSDNNSCEYSYYIDNYYQCVITGDKCKYANPDSKNCYTVDTFLSKKGDSHNANDR